MTGTAKAAQSSLAATAAGAFTAYRDGDQEGMDALVDAVTPLWHTVRSCGVDAQTAEDVIQTTWLTLVRRRESIADPQAVLKWLIVTARREAWRVSAAQRKNDPSDFDGSQLVARPADEPEATVLRDARQRTLWAQISTLSERCQQLLRVIAFADKPDYAVAQALGMPIGSIGPTRGRCLAQLRAALAGHSDWVTG